MTKDRLCVGVITGAHGIRGHVRLRSLTDDPLAIFSYEGLSDEAGRRFFKIARKGVAKDQFIVSVDSVSDRNEAEALAHTKLYIARDVLPPTKSGEFYQADLIGLDVRNEAGKAIGKVIALHDYGAGVFLEIKPTEGGSFMLPFRDAFVPTVDVEGGYLEAVVPEGWLSKNDEEKDL